jgi:hypothetical protein
MARSKYGELTRLNKNLVLIVKYNPDETTPEKIRDSVICLEGVQYVN